MILWALVLMTLVTGCKKAAVPENAGAATSPEPTPAKVRSLIEARKGFATNIVRKERIGEPAPLPPDKSISLVKYPSPAGDLEAYIFRPPSKEEKRPAIIWLVGGFHNSISQHAWTPGPATNDQSASTFWKAGIMTLYPSLRGGNDNPGHFENFYGEVDDVLAAAEFLAKQPDVDPARIYLGGHSTGGTLALLTAETGASFRGVFAFGPVEDVAGYGDDVLVFDSRNRQEVALRAPIRWMRSITAPTFVFEGTDGRSNIDSLRRMMRAPRSNAITFFPLSNADHFTLLQPVSALIASKILADRTPEPSITFTPEELAATLKK
jgi:acetyl esterase/lipase